MAEDTENIERMADVVATTTNKDILRVEGSIKKEISKLKYYLETADELIESKNRAQHDTSRRETEEKRC